MTWIVLTVCAWSVLLVNAITKKGVSLTFSDHYQCNDTFVLSNVSWWYDWGPNDSGHHAHGCHGSPRGEFIPMVWGYNGQAISLPRHSKYVLGFNEPNHEDQSRMTPGYAAANWPKLEAAAQDRLLMSPAPARCGVVGGLCTYTTFDWLDKFFSACKGCRVDYIALHSYTCKVDSDMQFLESAYSRYNRKVWLTEFACPGKPTFEQVKEYMEAIIPRLEKAEFVGGYSWFIARLTQSGYIDPICSLLEPNSSSLTPLGRLYNSL
ncbi:uncharacterized protein [Haliotis asinina]|uniref:uncharacterized protein n=1 Tax=Haliotis asinina TaxID=109174 RepID=UPI003531DCA4